MELWSEKPENWSQNTEIRPFFPNIKKSDAVIIIFPGGGYRGRAKHEGDGYALFLAENGITAFVVDYRVAPDRFPMQLLDARRAIRFVRAHADEFGIDANKIGVMGSSAGGHLAALTATYRKNIDFENLDEIDTYDPYPNAQILCYPVICSPADKNISHKGSYMNLIGNEDKEMEKELDPILNVSKQTPRAFIWHTSSDEGVNVINSYKYATALRNNDVETEMHIFPCGAHGLGLATEMPHVAQWQMLLLNWLKYMQWLN